MGSELRPLGQRFEQGFRSGRDHGRRLPTQLKVVSFVGLDTYWGLGGSKGICGIWHYIPVFPTNHQ